MKRIITSGRKGRNGLNSIWQKTLNKDDTFLKWWKLEKNYNHQSELHKKKKFGNADETELIGRRKI